MGDIHGVYRVPTVNDQTSVSALARDRERRQTQSDTKEESPKPHDVVILHDEEISIDLNPDGSSDPVESQHLDIAA